VTYAWQIAFTAFDERTPLSSLLRDCKRRGMRAPVLAVGDGALGFWRAVRDVFPQTRQGHHHYYEPVRRPTPRRYSAPHSSCCSVVSLSRPTWTSLSRWAFPSSIQPRQTRLASPSCRTPPGQSAATRQAHPGDNLKPRFDVGLIISTLRQRFTHVRLPDPHLTPSRRLLLIAHHPGLTTGAA
jgi:hypothetical protein